MSKIYISDGSIRVRFPFNLIYRWAFDGEHENMTSEKYKGKYYLITETGTRVLIEREKHNGK